jgi:hypothetical protein
MTAASAQRGGNAASSRVGPARWAVAVFGIEPSSPSPRIECRMIARRTLTTSAAVVLLSGPAWTCFAQTRRARLGAPAFLYKICEALRRFRRPNAPPLWPMGAAVRSAPEMSTSTAIRFRYRRRLPLIDIHNRPFRLCPSQPTPDPCQRMFSLARLTIRRARQERLPQVAGSLTFTTLLSIVPCSR